jgi:hypothetical protein
MAGACLQNNGYKNALMPGKEAIAIRLLSPLTDGKAASRLDIQNN